MTSEQSGELIDLDNSDVHGTYHADRNGHVKMVFNDKVQFRMYFEEKTITVPEGDGINFPYVTNDSNQIIYVVQSNAGSYIVLDKKVLSYDKENQIIEWQTTFNPNSLPIPQKDAKFRDEVTNGILMEETMTVSSNLSHTVNVANNKEAFDYQFNTDVNQAVVIKYKIKVKNPSLGTVRNKVISGEQVVDVPQNVEGNEKEDDDGATYNPLQIGEIGLSKSGRYLPDKREIEWTALLNENGKVPAAENNLMRDPIMDDQIYVNGSAKVEYRDGTVWNPLNQANVNFNEGDNQLEVSNFKMNSNAQRVIFRTKLKNNIDILNREIGNTACYKDSFTREKSAEASLTIDNANDYLLKKRGKQNVNNSDFVDWEVDINPYYFKLDNLVIVDDSWENQVVRRESIKLVDTASNRELYEGIDYDLEYTERYFKISMKNRVESKLLLTYQGGLIYPYGTPLGSNQIAKNSVRVRRFGMIIMMQRKKDYK